MPLTLTKTSYTENYFNGGGSIGGYDLYSATTYTNETAEQLATKFLTKAGLLGVDLTNRKVLVVGCAYGFLILYLRLLNVDAYGMDISSYAVGRTPLEISSKTMVGDASMSSSFAAVKAFAGMTKQNEKFDLIIDEDMLCCLTNAEAVTFRTLALNYGNMLMHFVDEAPTLAQWYNFHTIPEWKTILGSSPKEKWYSRFYWTED